MSDFDAMLQRKREEQSRKRKRKDIDIINDNDDIIAQLLADMRNAAEVSNFYKCLTKVCRYPKVSFYVDNGCHFAFSNKDTITICKTF